MWCRQVWDFLEDSREHLRAEILSAHVWSSGVTWHITAVQVKVSEMVEQIPGFIKWFKQKEIDNSWYCPGCFCFPASWGLFPCDEQGHRLHSDALLFFQLSHCPALLCSLCTYALSCPLRFCSVLEQSCAALECLCDTTLVPGHWAFKQWMFCSWFVLSPGAQGLTSSDTCNYDNFFLQGQVWLKDKEATHCKLCEKEFSLSKRKVKL